MHWFHSHASVRSLQSRESRFGSTAVIGLESMRDLASLKSSYRFEHVQAVPALHAAVVTVDGDATAVAARIGSDRPAHPLRLAARPEPPRAEPAERPAAPERRSEDAAAVRVAVRDVAPRAGARPHAGRARTSRSASSTPASTSSRTSGARSTACTTSTSPGRSLRRRPAATTTTATELPSRR